MFPSIGGDTQPYILWFAMISVCVFKVPGGGSSNLDRLSSDMEFWSCSITKSSSKKKSFDRVTCRNFTRSSMDNFKRVSNTQTHTNGRENTSGLQLECDMFKFFESWMTLIIGNYYNYCLLWLSPFTVYFARCPLHRSIILVYSWIFESFLAFIMVFREIFQV